MGHHQVSCQVWQDFNKFKHALVVENEHTQLPDVEAGSTILPSDDTSLALFSQSVAALWHRDGGQAILKDTINISRFLQFLNFTNNFDLLDHVWQARRKDLSSSISIIELSCFIKSAEAFRAENLLMELWTHAKHQINPKITSLLSSFAKTACELQHKSIFQEALLCWETLPDTVKTDPYRLCFLKGALHFEDPGAIFNLWEEQKNSLSLSTSNAKLFISAASAIKSEELFSEVLKILLETGAIFEPSIQQEVGIAAQALDISCQITLPFPLDVPVEDASAFWTEWLECLQQLDSAAERDACFQSLPHQVPPSVWIKLVKNLGIKREFNVLNEIIEILVRTSTATLPGVWQAIVQVANKYSDWQLLQVLWDHRKAEIQHLIAHVSVSGGQALFERILTWCEQNDRLVHPDICLALVQAATRCKDSVLQNRAWNVWIVSGQPPLTSHCLNLIVNDPSGPHLSAYGWLLDHVAQSLDKTDSHLWWRFARAAAVLKQIELTKRCWELCAFSKVPLLGQTWRALYHATAVCHDAELADHIEQAASQAGQLLPLLPGTTTSSLKVSLPQKLDTITSQLRDARKKGDKEAVFQLWDKFVGLGPNITWATMALFIRTATEMNLYALLEVIINAFEQHHPFHKENMLKEAMEFVFESNSEKAIRTITHLIVLSQASFRYRAFRVANGRCREIYNERFRNSLWQQIKIRHLESSPLVMSAFALVSAIGGDGEKLVLLWKGIKGSHLTNAVLRHLLAAAIAGNNVQIFNELLFWLDSDTLDDQKNLSSFTLEGAIKFNDYSLASRVIQSDAWKNGDEICWFVSRTCARLSQYHHPNLLAKLWEQIKCHLQTLDENSRLALLRASGRLQFPDILGPFWESFARTGIFTWSEWGELALAGAKNGRPIYARMGWEKCRSYDFEFKNHQWSDLFLVAGLIHDSEMLTDIWTAFQAKQTYLKARQWNAIITACGRVGSAVLLKDVLREHTKRKPPSDVVTTSVIATACGACQEAPLLWQVWEDVSNTYQQQPPELWGALARAAGEVSDGRLLNDIFSFIFSRDIELQGPQWASFVTSSTFVRDYTLFRHLWEAYQDLLPQGDVKANRAFLRAGAIFNDQDVVEVLLKSMTPQFDHLKHLDWVTLIRAAGKCSRPELLDQIWNYLVNQNSALEPTIWSAFFYAARRIRDGQRFRRYFDLMSAKNVVLDELGLRIAIDSAKEFKDAALIEMVWHYAKDPEHYTDDQAWVTIPADLAYHTRPDVLKRDWQEIVTSGLAVSKQKITQFWVLSLSISDAELSVMLWQKLVDVSVEEPYIDEWIELAKKAAAFHQEWAVIQIWGRLSTAFTLHPPGLLFAFLRLAIEMKSQHLFRLVWPQQQFHKALYLPEWMACWECVAILKDPNLFDDVWEQSLNSSFRLIPPVTQNISKAAGELARDQQLSQLWQECQRENLVADPALLSSFALAAGQVNNQNLFSDVCRSFQKIQEQSDRGCWVRFIQGSLLFESHSQFEKIWHSMPNNYRWIPESLWILIFTKFRPSWPSNFLEILLNTFSINHHFGTSVTNRDLVNALNTAITFTKDKDGSVRMKQKLRGQDSDVDILVGQLSQHLPTPYGGRPSQYEAKCQKMIDNFSSIFIYNPNPAPIFSNILERLNQFSREQQKEFFIALFNQSSKPIIRVLQGKYMDACQSCSPVRITCWQHLEPYEKERFISSVLDEEGTLSQLQSLIHRIKNMEELNQYVFYGLRDVSSLASDLFSRSRSRFPSEKQSIPEIIRDTSRIVGSVMEQANFLESSLETKVDIVLSFLSQLTQAVFRIILIPIALHIHNSLSGLYKFRQDLKSGSVNINISAAKAMLILQFFEISFVWQEGEERQRVKSIMNIAPVLEEIFNDMVDRGVSGPLNILVPYQMESIVVSIFHEVKANIIKAWDHLPCSDRRCHLSCSTSAGQLTIEITNNYLEDHVAGSGHLPANASSRGLGIQAIRLFMERINGVFRYASNLPTSHQNHRSVAGWRNTLQFQAPEEKE